ncbi:hypothetical protein PFISCL1PPCAC_21573, partial [Pristionchus fissidentatus]
KDEIELKDIEYEEFIVLLNVIYPSYKTPSDSSVKYLLKLGDLYGIQTVLDRSQLFLISSESIEIEEKLLLSDQYRLVKLQDHCLSTLDTTDSIKELSGTPQYNKLSETTKVALLEKLLKLI